MTRTVHLLLSSPCWKCAAQIFTSKTSVLRRWKDANKAVLPKVADRTIGVEMALLCIGENGEHFVVLYLNAHTFTGVWWSYEGTH